MIPDTPLTSASDLELADAVQENLYALFRAAATLPDGELVETDRLCFHHTFPYNPMFKSVWQTRLTPDEVDAEIDRMTAWFQARKAPFFFWWVGPHTSPADLPERLKARGFVPDYEQAQGMVIDLAGLNQYANMPDGFTIVRALERTQMDDWCVALAAAYDVPIIFPQSWRDAILAAGIERAPWQLYIGYWEGKPVATNLLFNGAGAAGLYAIGTIPEARGKGIGAAITLKPLLDARDMGYRYGVLFSSEMGYPVYRRLGFREVDCKIGRYLWENPE